MIYQAYITKEKSGKRGWKSSAKIRQVGYSLGVYLFSQRISRDGRYKKRVWITLNIKQQGGKGKSIDLCFW